MADVTGFLDELTASTQRHIVPGLIDQFGKNDPLLAYMKKNNLEKFPGGTQIQENFIYAYLPNGGAFSEGENFTMEGSQVETGATFNPKLYVVPVTISKIQAQVFNKGPEMAFRLIDGRLQIAALTMSAHLAIALYNEGQSATRTKHMNGLAEMLNDGTNNSWTAAAYTTYGTISRTSGAAASALRSPMTSPTASVSGPITYKILEEGYNSVVIGDEYPNLMVTTNLGMSYIKEKFQPQWRVETQDPKIGFNGVKFNQAMLIQSQYAPGTVGVNDANIGNYNASAGETLFYLNTKYFRMWVTDDAELGFGFTGFKPEFDGLMIGGQYCFVGNVTCQAPRLNRHLFAITG